jgi:hypothetical protein
MFSSLFHIFAIAPAQCEKSFFGLTTWYHFLNSNDFVNSKGVTDCTIHNFTFLATKSDIALVLLAVVDDLLRIAGIVAVAFVIYGGFQYVASQGSGEKTARAQNTITDALIGLAVAIAAVGIVSFLGAKLGGA